MSLTLTKEELKNIKCAVEDIFLEYEKNVTKANLTGSSKYSMKEGNELAMYTFLLRDVDYHDFQNDTYVSLLSNSDVFSMYDRALVIINKTR